MHDIFDQITKMKLLKALLRKVKVIGLLTAIALLMPLVGCRSTKMAERSAHQANAILKETTRDIALKTSAEEKAYDDYLSLADESFIRRRTEMLTERNLAYAQKFASTHPEGKGIDESAVRELVKSSTSDWSAHTVKLGKERAKVLGTLTEQRKSLAMSNTEIEELEKQLALLSKPRNKKKLVSFYAKYASAVASDFDQAE
tara:strand:- start:453 stop:1055 length:603 start_codon:yes stop_codon:yes gene_type:complete